jgi:hypothetical protein
MSVLVQAQQVREATYGIQLVSPTEVVPSVSGSLWTVSGGPIRVTSLVAVVTTVFTATVTSLNIGTLAGASTLINAAALANAAVGTVFVGIPTSSVPVIAAPGGITWIAGAANTGQVQVYMSYIPVTSLSLAQ